MRARKTTVTTTRTTTTTTTTSRAAARRPHRKRIRGRVGGPSGGQRSLSGMGVWGAQRPTKGTRLPSAASRVAATAGVV